MKSFAFAAIAALGFVGAASAADMPVKAPVAPAKPIQLPYNWGGLNIGGHLGYLWGPRASKKMASSPIPVRQRTASSAA